MSLMNIKNMKNEKGFTIVELLIVIVVIGILAAITIVAYNGVQNRAKTTSAASAANTADTKAEAYNGENSNYPLVPADLTGATSDKSYATTGVTIQTAAITAAPTSPNTVQMIKCGSGSPATQAAITATNIVGVRFYYWNYSNGNANTYVTSGQDTGTGILCPLS